MRDYIPFESGNSELSLVHGPTMECDEICQYNRVGNDKRPFTAVRSFSEMDTSVVYWGRR